MPTPVYGRMKLVALLALTIGAIADNKEFLVACGDGDYGTGADSCSCAKASLCKHVVAILLILP